MTKGLCFSKPSDMEFTWELVRQAESQGPLELLSPHFHLNKISEWYVHTSNLGSSGFVLPGWRPLTLHRSLSYQLHTFSTIHHHQSSAHPAHTRTGPHLAHWQGVSSASRGQHQVQEGPRRRWWDTAPVSSPRSSDFALKISGAVQKCKASLPFILRLWYFYDAINTKKGF